MEEHGSQKCRGCGATLTLFIRSLDMSGYCGKCAARAHDEDGLAELPADVDVASIANARLKHDATRLTLIAILASVSCFGGAIFGAIAAGPDHATGGYGPSLQGSWLFCLAGLFVGKLIFLRRGSVLTFARWKVFWGWFIVFYFLTYIPLAILLPQINHLPLPADIATFALACFTAYAVGMFSVVVKDETLKKWLCERCALPSPMVEAARNNDWADAQRMIDETVAQSHGLASADNLVARLYLDTGLEKRRAGDTDAAVGDFRKGWETAGASDTVRFKIAGAVNEAGGYSEACDMLLELVSASKDKDLVRCARKLTKTIRRRNKLTVRCPECGRALSGTTDMIGDEAVCTKCKTEFTISEDLVAG